MRSGIAWVALGVLQFLPVAAFGQTEATSAEAREANLKSYIELLRKDIKTQKVAIHSELLGLTPEEGAKFWPLYNEYDKALTKLGDEKVALIRLYSEHYGMITPEVATQVTMGALDLEEKRTQLKRQYFQKISQAVDPIMAARFLQVENQLERIIDLQVSASLPIVE